MQGITSLSKVSDYLSNFKSNKAVRYSVDNTSSLLRYLGNPQDDYRTIHVAGTSGKTSTSYYISELLTRSGLKPGLSVSPSVSGINDRVQVNTKPLNEARFCKLFTEFINLIKDSGVSVSWFEIMTAFSLWTFSKLGVDYAVIEVGLGGLNDATNVFTRQDKVCVITDIGKDHTKILGDTLSAIATQKAGIIHSGNPVFCYKQSGEIMSAIVAFCEKQGGLLYIIDPENNINPQMPDYQFRNWNLAYQVYNYVSARNKTDILNIEEVIKTQTIVIPGRMEVKIHGGKTIILDGAHNPQKMAAFVISFKKLYPDIKPRVLFGMTQNKDYLQTIKQLSKLEARVIVTDFDKKSQSPGRSVDASLLERCFNKNAEVEVDANVRDSFEKLMLSNEPVLVITGSIYLISQIKTKFLS